LWFHNYVRDVLGEVVDHPVLADSDGDFPVHGETSTGWVRPEPTTPWGVQIIVYAALAVPVKAATLKEINQINLAERLVKVVLLPEGVVVVNLRLFADAVTEENLGGALIKVMQVADRVGPLLVAVHGGHTPIPMTSQPALDE
jgi:hypothetical protein